ncbi:MAG: 2-keto-4-pentenoate hydratase [Vicinamibacterales bacterium]
MTTAGDLLWDCWQNGRRLQSLPEEVRPRTRDDGYAVQATLESRSSAPLFGWKIAATSLVGQKHINVTGPLAGRLLHERVTDLSAVARSAKAEPAIPELPFGANHMKVVEAEFAFRMARDLPPRAQPYSVDEVLDAVATLHPAIEVPDSRFDDFTVVGAPQLIADNACAHLFVLGPPAPSAWREIDLVEHRVIGDVGRPFMGRWEPSLTREGKGANVLGDPRVALAWLANELSGLGITLKAGEVVTTGTCLVPLPIAPGVDVNADFGTLGSVSARIV